VFACSVTASSVSSVCAALSIPVNKVELDNLTSIGQEDVNALCDLLESAVVPAPEYTGGGGSPGSTHKSHLALSGVSHVDFTKQYKPFPEHWGAKPNAQMKGFEGAPPPAARPFSCGPALRARGGIGAEWPLAAQASCMICPAATAEATGRWSSGYR
jgi:hypothetical protein